MSQSHIDGLSQFPSGLQCILQKQAISETTCQRLADVGPIQDMGLQIVPTNYQLDHPHVHIKIRIRVIILEIILPRVFLLIFDALNQFVFFPHPASWAEPCSFDRPRLNLSHCETIGVIPRQWVWLRLWQACSYDYLQGPGVFRTHHLVRLQHSANAALQVIVDTVASGN